MSSVTRHDVNRPKSFFLHILLQLQGGRGGHLKIAVNMLEIVLLENFCVET